MRITGLFIAVAMVAGLAGCASSGVVSPKAAQVADVHTGDTLTHSERKEISAGLLASTYATAVHSPKVGFGLYVQRVATGDGWILPRSAWSYGTQYPFKPESGDVLGCGAGCTLSEGGMVLFSESQFRKAATAGFDFKLVGSKGEISGSVPSELFAQVLAQL